MSSLDFEPDSARCRLFARGSQSGFAFGASGSQQFVAGATAGAAIGYGIAAAVERNGNFNDCMQARGWRIADGSAPTSDAAMTAKLMATDQPASTIASAPGAVSTQAPVVPISYNASASRRELRVRAVDVTPAIASSVNLSPPRGVAVLAVDPSGAAWAGGVRNGDIILSFNGTPVNGISDMQRDLSGIEPNTTAAVAIWRNSAERSIAIQF